MQPPHWRSTWNDPLAYVWAIRVVARRSSRKVASPVTGSQVGSFVQSFCTCMCTRKSSSATPDGLSPFFLLLHPTRLPSASGLASYQINLAIGRAASCKKQAPLECTLFSSCTTGGSTAHSFLPRPRLLLPFPSTAECALKSPLASLCPPSFHTSSLPVSHQP